MLVGEAGLSITSQSYQNSPVPSRTLMDQATGLKVPNRSAFHPLRVRRGWEDIFRDVCVAVYVCVVFWFGLVGWFVVLFCFVYLLFWVFHFVLCLCFVFFSLYYDVPHCSFFRIKI